MTEQWLVTIALLFVLLVSCAVQTLHPRSRYIPETLQ